MQQLKRFAPGWYRADYWMRYWIFCAGAVLMVGVAIANIYIAPHTLAARLLLMTTAAIAFGVTASAGLYRQRSGSSKE